MPINTDQTSSTYTLEGRMREFLDNAVATGKYDKTIDGYKAVFHKGEEKDCSIRLALELFIKFAVL